MSQWLKLQIADQFGIAANIDFPLPATFIWDIFKQVLPQVPERSAFSKEQMSWRLMQIIPDFLTQDEFKPLASYLADDDSQIKGYQLSAKIADIFDQYLVYRSDWVNQWESGALVSSLEGEDAWQSKLWKALFEHTVGSGASFYHRANLYQRCIDTLKGGRCPAEIKALRRIFVFGVSALPPKYLEVLTALGNHIDVHFMLSNPCQYYWGDILDQKYLAKLANKQRLSFLNKPERNLLKAPVEDYIQGSAGNSLLASWGKVGRDMQRLLSECTASEVEAFVEPADDSLLHHIQNDMLMLNDRSITEEHADSVFKEVISHTDSSFKVSVCHSPMREVEVLHNYLLDLMNDDSELYPRDVVVMVSDVDVYSPYINAVFSSQPKEQFIPYSISDLSTNQFNSVVQAYLWVLGMKEHRCTASELIAFIQVPSVLKRFGILESELSLLTHWIGDVGIRWGLEPESAVEFDLPEMTTNTWLFGLKRMLAGYAIPESSGVVNGVLSYDQIQGLSSELAGKLGILVNEIINIRSRFQASMAVSQWHALLNELLNQCFLATNEEDSHQIHLIRDNISRWVEEISMAGFEVGPSEERSSEISSEVVFEVMSEKLIQQRISQRFLAGQINFCTLMPMRSVPFKVVCLLGMDGNAYPRQQTPLGFDLMHGRFEYGDRSRRDDDRFLFLEAVLSAQEKLMISYTGKSIRDNSDIIPSILVSELLEYCADGFVLDGDSHLKPAESAQRMLSHLVSTRALNPYSVSEYQPTQGGYRSFDQHWFDIAKLEGCFEADAVDFMAERLPGCEWPEFVEIKDLKAFWNNPVSYFFKSRLSVNFDSYDALLQDEESFELDALQLYQLKNQLLTYFLSENWEAELEENSDQKLFERVQAQGILPHGNFGSLVLQEQVEATHYLYTKVKPYVPKQVQPVEVCLDLAIDDSRVRLEGWLSNLGPSGYVNYRVGRVRPKDLMSAWVDHLAGAAIDQPEATHLIGFNPKTSEVEHLMFKVTDKLKATQILSNLLKAKIEGSNHPLFFEVNVASIYLEKLNSPRGGEEAALVALLDALDSWFEGDEYVSRCWSEINEDMISDFIETTQTFYAEMSEHLVSVREESDSD
ncbi:exodeoxyribonuclease V subunit gamma [Litoribacillus peritrichatus]|uniref:RecBCD enzyme subunit RecC n=2 Tax=Litoribacillus peritrichatus TaxID=718191 RepID=A0ABP7MF74_9GAMM